MRLGEFKTKTREFDGRQIIYLSDYTDGTEIAFRRLSRVVSKRSAVSLDTSPTLKV